MNVVMAVFMNTLNDNRNKISKQQYKTLRGQARSGNVAAAFKGLQKILNREVGSNG